MELISLASGSSGNCFYIEHHKKAILVDAGISAKQIALQLALKGKSPEHIHSIFITHEHTDHVRGCDVLARKLNIPIFATKKTIEARELCKNSDLIHPIHNRSRVEIAELTITAFPKSHAAADPVSFSVENDKKLVIATDSGFVDKQLEENIQDSDFLCLESNHDPDMLGSGPYPIYLKKWIRSDLGHLSNNQAALAILNHVPSSLKTILLSHLSQTNNTPQKALNTISSTLKQRNELIPELITAPRHQSTNIFSI